MDESLNDAGGVLVMAAVVCLEKFSAIAKGMFVVFVILFRRSEVLKLFSTMSKLLKLKSSTGGFAIEFR